MQLRRLPAAESPVRRVVETLWLPYHRELAATVERFGLADDADHVAAQTEFLCDRLDGGDYHAWVAIDDDRVVADLTADAELVGFVAVGRDEAPDNFDRPDRLVVADLYVQPSHRGTGLVDDLLDRAVQHARERGCPELALDVDVDNERAAAVYDRRGFETVRHRRVRRVDN